MSKINFEDFLEVLKTRRSIRKFLPDEITEADIKKIIQAASYAPSGGNLQNWHFIITRPKEVRERMLEVISNKIEKILPSIGSQKARNEFSSYSKYMKIFEGAPVVIAVIRKPYRSLASGIMKRFKIPYKTDAGIQGVSAAIQNLLLAAHVLGYGACWMTGPLIAREELEKLLGVSAEDELAALIPLGKYQENPAPTPRKSVEEISSFKD